MVTAFFGGAILCLKYCPYQTSPTCKAVPMGSDGFRLRGLSHFLAPLGLRDFAFRLPDAGIADGRRRRKDFVAGALFPQGAPQTAKMKSFHEFSMGFHPKFGLQTVCPTPFVNRKLLSQTPFVGGVRGGDSASGMGSKCSASDLHVHQWSSMPVLSSFEPDWLLHVFLFWEIIYNLRLSIFQQQMQVDENDLFYPLAWIVRHVWWTHLSKAMWFVRLRWDLKAWNTCYI